MIVPFCDIPSQFLIPLNVETKVHYTLDMKKFPGLSSDAAPALIIAPSKVKTDLVECGRECCSGLASLPATPPEVDYATATPDLPPVTLIDAQKELFHLLDSYQLDDSLTDVHRGNLAESVAYSSPACYKQDLCRTTACSRDSNRFMQSTYSGSRRGNSGRPSVDRTARKYSPYQAGKYRNTAPCVPLACDRKACYMQPSNDRMNSRSCRLSTTHHNDILYCDPFPIQKPCSVERQELKEIPYSCNYSYAQNTLTQCSLDSIRCNISKLPYSNTVYQYDYSAITGYAGHNSGYNTQSNSCQMHKENLQPIPTLMV